uniref:transketolase n=1 Tax=Percolomonas cosmopolitus TaxID=63605 RepID=A0A7S1KP45_9EUKA
MTTDQLKNFRQLHSKTPGHPENAVTEGVEVTTGPLGQGLANSVGIALAQEHLRSTFSTEDFPDLFGNHYTYVFCGDGCLMEGVTSEACSLAGHLGLGRLIVIYDNNNITIDGTTDISFTEDVQKRYESYGWHTQHVKNGNSDLDGIEKAIKNAQQVNDKPSFIILDTTIGYGSKVEHKPSAHGYGISSDEAVAELKKSYGMDPSKKYYVSDEVKQYWDEVKQRGDKNASQWNERLAAFEKKYPEKAKELHAMKQVTLPENLKDILPSYKPGTSEATRKMSGKALNAIGDAFKGLIGGSADLAGSNCSKLANSTDFSTKDRTGRNINFGVREHAMCAMANGIASYGCFVPYVATFLNFMGYAWGAGRLSALSERQVLYIFTHDSVALGEDGPTHQPIEILSMLRATPGFYVFRPADGNETNASYAVAMSKTKSPSLLAFTRQNVPNLENSTYEKALKGGYILEDVENPELILLATGSEVSLCVETAKKLTNRRIRVVSMPSVEVFEEQSEEYRRSVLGNGSAPILSVEAGATHGWQKYSHVQFGIDHFGMSAPDNVIWEQLGFTPEKLGKKVEKVIGFYGNNQGQLYDVSARPQLEE